MYIQKRNTSYNGLGQYYGAQDPVQAALPASVAIDSEEVKQTTLDPNQYIPAKPVTVSTWEAMKIMRRPIGSHPKTKVTEKAAGKVFWSKGKPTFSRGTIKGEVAERVPKPTIKLKPNVKVVRDKPRLQLAPIEMPTEESFKGLGELSRSNLILVVLGLIIAGVVLYRMR